MTIKDISTARLQEVLAKFRSSRQPLGNPDTIFYHEKVLVAPVSIAQVQAELKSRGIE